MRSYEISITVHSPIVLGTAAAPEDREALFRHLNDLLTDLAIEVDRTIRARLSELPKQAAKAGISLEIPMTHESPMGVSYGFTDVTGHVGKRWNRKRT